MTLSYPLDIDINNDWVTFNHRPYRSNSESGFQGSSPPKAHAPNTNQGIKLYMPNSTPPASQGNTWNDQNFTGPKGDMMKSLAAGSVGLGDTILEGGGTNFEEIGESAGSMISSNVAKAINNGGGLAKQVVLDAVAGPLGFGSGQNIMAFSSGKIFNPNVELLYQGPTLRGFNFQFVFVPKNSTESGVVDDIIKTFKEYSAADDDSEKGYLHIPHIWDIEYQGIGSKKLNKFKPCALTNITVVDNPQAQSHTTFVDGTPVATMMTLAFKEVDYVFRKDHAEGIRGF